MWSKTAALAIDEVGHVPVEQLRELEMRSVVGVWEEDQLGVGEVLLQDVGVDGGDDDVVAAVNHERGVRDSFEVVEAVWGCRAPLVRRRQMRGDGGVRNRD